MIAFPDIRQRDDIDCGYVCLDGILQLFGVRTCAALAIPTVSNPVSGTDPTAAEAVLRASGLAVVSGTMRLSDLRHFTQNGSPVMCPVSLYGGHWIVVLKVTPKTVTYHDPMRGRVTMPPDAFTAIWKDVTRLGHTFNQWGIACNV